MNYDQPRQLAEGEHAGKWQYTSANRRSGTHAIGYCSGAYADGANINDVDTWVPHFHDTEAEARECYGQYLRDHVRLDEPGTWSWGTCDLPDCKNPANNGAHSGAWHMALLCADHHNLDDAVEALSLDGPAGDSIHS